MKKKIPDNLDVPNKTKINRRALSNPAAQLQNGVSISVRCAYTHKENKSDIATKRAHTYTYLFLSRQRERQFLMKCIKPSAYAINSQLSRTYPPAIVHSNKAFRVI